MLAGRTVSVMLWMGNAAREALFTLAKPLEDPFWHLVNIVLERSVRRGGRA